MRKALGKKIKNARIKAGLTQQDLADKLNIARPHISSIESGNENLTVDSLEKITKALKRKLLIVIS